MMMLDATRKNCVLGIALLAALAVGCERETSDADSSPARAIPVVRVVKPQLRSITRAVSQPGFVEAYEQTAIYSKVSGFIKKFYVDIGDPVKTGQLLCEVLVPELNEEHQRKVAQVDLDKRAVEQAEKLVTVADSNLRTALAQFAEANAEIGRYQADVVRWESEAKRDVEMVKEKYLDKQVLDETEMHLDSSKAARDAAQAAAAARDAACLSAAAAQGKARIDVRWAEANVKVAEADERETAARLAYTKVTAPYDGVITVRNANTGDFVQAATGDKSGSGSSAPIFVVARDDFVRVYVDVPEAFARYVDKGTKAVVRAEALDGLEISAAVTRISWSLHERTRTLRAEIDLAVKDYPALRPGMYVYGKVLIQRPPTRVLPAGAVAMLGNETFCYLFRDGKAVRTHVQRGLSDGTWVEILKKKVADAWVPLQGDEEVIAGDVTEIADGQQVQPAREEPS
jgi:RND family efflux transporter MFP subunit